MIPRAMMGPVVAIARGPARPPLERKLVREAVDAVAARSTPREPLARDLARRVVEELASFLVESDDPLLAALGEMNRKVFPSPVVELATSPDIDTIAVFVEARVDALRARSGRQLELSQDRAEIKAILKNLEVRLSRRYLRHLRFT